MLDSRLLWPFAPHLPSAFSGSALHRGALLAMSRGDLSTADRLFETAAAHYRREVMVEALARLRVHQLIARVRAGATPDEERTLEIERRLCLLDQIESLEFPFARVDARTLLGRWGSVSGARAEDLPIAA
jgi:hypothetical protein